MDIKQLEFFVTACERGSLSQAALCLYTSQPNVSKTIRSLERELGYEKQYPDFHLSKQYDSKASDRFL